MASSISASRAADLGHAQEAYLGHTWLLWRLEVFVHVLSMLVFLMVLKVILLQFGGGGRWMDREFMSQKLPLQTRMAVS